MAEEQPSTKLCSLCKVEKPAAEFGKNPRTPTGLRSRCKQCDRDSARDWAKANPERARENDLRRTARNPGRTTKYSRQWRLRNPEQAREIGRAWKQANPEKVQASTARYKAENALREPSSNPKCCARCGETKPGTEFAVERGKPDGRNGTCRPCSVLAAAEWAKANPERARLHARLICGRRRAAGAGRVRADVIVELAKMQKGRCAVCAEKLNRKFHIDHIVPIARGGKHERRNLQLLCQRCNLRKAASDPLAFMRSRGLLL